VRHSPGVEEQLARIDEARERERWEIEGGISDDQVQVALAGLPRCATCGGLAAKIHYHAHELFRLSLQVDGYDGSPLAYAEHDETLSREPDVNEAGVLVECEGKHQWREPRLGLDHNGDWRVKPAA
jgi:hypothetical protein